MEIYKTKIFLKNEPKKSIDLRKIKSESSKAR